MFLNDVLNILHLWTKKNNVYRQTITKYKKEKYYYLECLLLDQKQQIDIEILTLIYI